MRNNPYSAIFNELALGTLELSGMPFQCSNKDLLNVSIIMQFVLMNKFWELSNEEKISMEIRGIMAEKMGSEIHDTIHKFTGISLKEIKL